MQSDVDSLCTWCEKWKLQLNPSKCKTLSITANTKHQFHQHLMYSIDGTSLSFTSTQRDLGVLVRSDLSWKDHINKICLKAYRSLNMIRRSLPSDAPSQLKKHLYTSLVKSHITYCSQLWRPRLIKDILSVERVQRKATKYILNNYSLDYKTRLERIHLLPLMYWLEMQDIMFLVKCLQDPNDTINIRSHISFSSTTTRAGSDNKLKYKYQRTSAGRHFYFNRVARLWNKFPATCLDLSKSFCAIKKMSVTFYGNISRSNLILKIHALSTFNVPVTNVMYKDHLDSNLSVIFYNYLLNTAAPFLVAV